MRELPFRYGAGEADRVVYSVTEFTREVRAILESSFDLVSVRGEISNLSRPQSGHIYFSLVADDGGRAGGSRFASAQVPVVMWRSAAARLRFCLESGMKAVVTGRVTVYEPRGTYQITADRITPEGIGDLQVAFEQLKEKLQGEGLFEAGRKRPLPFFPSRIGVVTSPTGAAVRDFLRVLWQRFPRAWVRVIPARVQGEGAAEEIAGALDRFGLPENRVDVIVVTRGGGSLEDLWAFNEEVVARALARAGVPTVSAVGHETDFTISDFVADLRAPTPTAAAEAVVPAESDLVERLEGGRRRLVLALRAALERGRSRLDRAMLGRPYRDPQLIVQKRFERVDEAVEALQNSLYNLWQRWNDVLFVLAARLVDLSPFSVLSRGYSVTTTPDGRVVRKSTQVRRGDPVLIRLAEGRVRATVEETEDQDPETTSGWKR